MVHSRFAVAAVLAASLAGCSFFDFSDDSARYQGSGGPGAARPVQLAALPGYLSDEDIVPARPAGSVLGLLPAVPLKPSGFVGIPSRRPGLAPVLVSPPRRVLTFANFVPSRPLGELKAMGTPLRAESYTLADLIEDQAWRKRTSRRLERLFR